MSRKGEGAHGGHVVGHTRSGRPIYAANSSVYRRGGATAEDFSGYTAQDHRDAYNHHDDAWQHAKSGAFRHGHAPGFSPMPQENRDYRSHQDAADTHQRILSRLRKSSGEGSRGGHIIGHTRSGKAIYAPGHAHYLNMPGDGEDKRSAKVTHLRIFAGPLSDRYKDFTHRDHMDAARAHVAHSQAAVDETDRIRTEQPNPEKTNWPKLVQAFAVHTAHEHAGLAHLAAAGHEDPYQARDDMRVAKSRIFKSEGSRGGHIIGHSRSGKPIYATHHEANGAVLADAHRQNGVQGVITSGKAARQAHLGYSKGDHLDAAAHHADMAAYTSDHKVRHDSHALSQAHAAASMSLATPKKDDLSPEDRPSVKKSEGSRGGHIIGHTKTGKPIYQSSQGASGRLSHLGVRGFTAGDHADAIAVHTALLSSGLPEPHAASAKRAIAYHQRKSTQAPAPGTPSGIQSTLPHPGAATHDGAPKSTKQNPTRALSSLSSRLWGIKTDEASISSGQYRKDRKAVDRHALKVHDRHFKDMTAEQHLALASKPVEGSTPAERGKSMAARAAHGTMAHALFARQRGDSGAKGIATPGVHYGLPPPAQAPAQATMKSAAHSILNNLGLESGDSVTILTPAEKVKVLNRILQNLRLSGMRVEGYETADGGYAVRPRPDAQPVEIRPDGAVKRPDALVLFGLGDDLALAKAGIAMPGVPAPPKPPALPKPPTAAPAAPKPPGNAVLGKTHTGGTVWAHAKADSPIYRAFGPRDHAQAANLHQLAGNHAAAGEHRAMHAKLTAPKAPAMAPAALAARPKMGIGRMAHSNPRRPDMVKWESQEVLGEWLSDAPVRKAGLFSMFSKPKLPAMPHPAVADAPAVHPPAAPSAAPGAATGGKGAGSRGGQVIGHTASGKPVYASHSAHQYPSFKAADHEHAWQMHEQAAKTHAAAGNAAAAKAHNDLGREHAKRASSLYAQDRLKTSMGEKKYQELHGKPKRVRKPRSAIAAGTKASAPAEGAPPATQAEA